MIIIKNKGIDVKIYIPKDSGDIAPSSKKVTITQNGNYQLIGRNDVTVDVKGGGILPTETINITENGEYDVTDYAKAIVEVSNQEKIDELEQQIQTLEGDKKALETQLAAAQEQISIDENTIARLNNEIADKIAQINALNEQINTLVETVDAKSEEIRSLNTQKESLELQVSNLTNDINVLNQRVNTLEAEKTALQARLDSITSKSITNNGVYTPESGVEGWNSVTVNVNTGEDRIPKGYSLKDMYNAYIKMMTARMHSRTIGNKKRL